MYEQKTPDSTAVNAEIPKESGLWHLASEFSWSVVTVQSRGSVEHGRRETYALTEANNAAKCSLEVLQL